MSAEQNRLTQTGSGTPGGEPLRRDWQPIGLLDRDCPRRNADSHLRATGGWRAALPLPWLSHAQGSAIEVGSPEELRSLLETEIPKWAAVVKAGQVRLD